MNGDSRSSAGQKPPHTHTGSSRTCHPTHLRLTGRTYYLILLVKMPNTSFDNHPTGTDTLWCQHARCCGSIMPVTLQNRPTYDWPARTWAHACARSHNHNSLVAQPTSLHQASRVCQGPSNSNGSAGFTPSHPKKPSRIYASF